MAAVKNSVVGDITVRIRIKNLLHNDRLLDDLEATLAKELNLQGYRNFDIEIVVDNERDVDA